MCKFLLFIPARTKLPFYKFSAPTTQPLWPLCHTFPPDSWSFNNQSLFLFLVKKKVTSLIWSAQKQNTFKPLWCSSNSILVTSIAFHARALVYNFHINEITLLFLCIQHVFGSLFQFYKGSTYVTFQSCEFRLPWSTDRTHYSVIHHAYILKT